MLETVFLENKWISCLFSNVHLKRNYIKSSKILWEVGWGVRGEERWGEMVKGWGLGGLSGWGGDNKLKMPLMKLISILSLWKSSLHF